jgi:hypothetical protein
MLIATVLGVLSALLARPTLGVTAAAVMFLLALLTMSSLGWLIMVVSGLLLLVASDSAPLQGVARSGIRGIGSLSGLLAAVYLFGGFRAPLLLVIPALFVLLAGWLPMRSSRSAPSTEYPFAK